MIYFIQRNANSLYQLSFHNIQILKVLYMFLAQAYHLKNLNKNNILTF